MERPTILLADDESAVLDRVRRLLESQFQVVETVSDGQALLAAADRLKPDVILADISMPVLNGFEAARRLKAAAPSTRIIFLTVHEEPAVVTEALGIGVNGYVVKRAAAQDLVAAIREVLEGRCFVSPALSL
ncbi:MAG: hypothetical protein A3H28_13425 [Acidobacteria bacterium RIFCSPLOWO2_02_FULL_61_28]|nr:MAG: hypothetical protein A3H28_13425 [Acidobacteria bacterium RIFCSPLOWO2_02_FULL_61_28]